MWTAPPNTIRCLFGPLPKFSKQRPIARCEPRWGYRCGVWPEAVAGCDGARSVGEDALGDAPEVPSRGVFSNQLRQLGKNLGRQLGDVGANAQVFDA